MKEAPMPLVGIPFSLFFGLPRKPYNGHNSRTLALLINSYVQNVMGNSGPFGPSFFEGQATISGVGRVVSKNGSAQGSVYEKVTYVGRIGWSHSRFSRASVVCFLGNLAQHLGRSLEQDQVIIEHDKDFFPIQVSKAQDSEPEQCVGESKPEATVAGAI